MAFYPYLAFAGTCRQAFSRYQQIFGGELTLIPMADMPGGEDSPDANPDTIIHAALESPIGLLMGADDPSGNFDGRVHGMCVNCQVDGVDEAKRVFEALAQEGQVQMPIGETFFSPGFGMCIDRFGTPWMVVAGMPPSS